MTDTTRPDFDAWITDQLAAAHEQVRTTYDAYMTSQYQNPTEEAKNMIHWARATARVQLLDEVQAMYIASGDWLAGEVRKAS